jgi:hypothetical protein
VDLDALAKKKPLFVYYYVASVTDPMNDNYKFSRKFELSVLGEELVDALNKNFVCKKVELPPEADMKIAANQARIEIWSPTEKKIGTIGIEQEAQLNKTPFLGFLKVRMTKSESLVKAEIARITKLRKDAEAAKAGKKETAKGE